jgi:hypothetical protein
VQTGMRLARRQAARSTVARKLSFVRGAEVAEELLVFYLRVDAAFSSGYQNV